MAGVYEIPRLVADLVTVMLFDCTRAAERDRGVQAAIDAVQRGDLVVMPTDTVYGIGADAFKSWAVTALQNAKGRGRGRAAAGARRLPGDRRRPRLQRSPRSRGS